MWFWNRVEIYCGYSQETFTELRNCLDEKGIRNDYKLVNNIQGSRARFGSLGIDHKYETMYYLYVHHKDYDQAMYITSNRAVKRNY